MDMLTIVYPTNDGVQFNDDCYIAPSGEKTPLSRINTTRHLLGDTLAAVPDGPFYVVLPSGHTRLHEKQGFRIEHTASGDLMPINSDEPDDATGTYIIDGRRARLRIWNAGHRGSGVPSVSLS